MSEYQYYEFQALDRPLTQREMRELRKYSTRATITDTRFVNHEVPEPGTVASGRTRVRDFAHPTIRLNE
jgi:hypothetical protein